MNIFWLSLLLEECARAHANAHVVKMISESCQLLSTAHWVLQPKETPALFENGQLWKATHQNHPCAVWARQHPNNYAWLAGLALALCKEFEVRFSGAAHKALTQIEFLAAHPPKAFPETSTTITLHFDAQVTMPPQCVPDDCLVPGDPVAAYQRYYQSQQKAHLRWWRPKSIAITFDDSQQYVPCWFAARPLAPPKYFLQAVDRAQKSPCKKRKVVETEPIGKTVRVN